MQTDMPGQRSDNRRRLEGFDGLRACAVFLVMAYHAGNAVGAASYGSLAPLVSALKAGVTVFFVISGFLLYLPHARAMANGSNAPDWREYGRRRAARILPGYWVALTVLAAASLITGVFGPQWWKFYGLLQIYGNGTLEGGLGVAWTLAVEVSFYVTLPFLAWGLRRVVVAARTRPARTQVTIVVGLALASLEFRGWLAGSPVLPVRAPGVAVASWLPFMWDWFALGLVLAVLRAEWERGARFLRPVEALAHHPAASWVLAGAVFTGGVLLQHGEDFLSAYGPATHVAFGVAAALFVLPAVAPSSGESRRRSRPLALLRSRQATWLGTISYGVFLWHVPLRDQFYKWMGDPRGALWYPAMFALTVAGGLALGAASWYLVERPAQAWIRARRPGAGRAVSGQPPEERPGVPGPSTAVSASIPLS